MSRDHSTTSSVLNGEKCRGRQRGSREGLQISVGGGLLEKVTGEPVRWFPTSCLLESPGKMKIKQIKNNQCGTPPQAS